MLEVSFKLPYLGEFKSRNVLVQVQQAISSAYPFVQVVAFYKTQRWFLPRVKDVLPVVSQSSVIYMFLCGCGHDYIGRTETQLGCRIKQHVPKWLCDGNKSRPRSKAPLQSSITKHIVNCTSFSPQP